MEKARSVKHKRDQQLEDILKVVENLEMKHVDLMRETIPLMKLSTIKIIEFQHWRLNLTN